MKFSATTKKNQTNKQNQKPKKKQATQPTKDDDLPRPLSVDYRIVVLSHDDKYILSFSNIFCFLLLHAWVKSLFIF